jgi:hypothetical protein
MSATPRRRRARGSLSAAKRMYWAVALVGLEMAEDTQRPDDARCKGGNMCIAALTGWRHAHETSELEERVATLEEVASGGNGHYE